MKKDIRIVALLITLMTASVPAMAQYNLRSAYFTEGYTYRHRMNPAFANERNYVSMPVLGNFNISMQSTVGVSDFIYKKENGDLTTFLNQSVSSDEFLSGLKNRNRINLDLDLNIMSAGFFAWGGFNTIDLSVKSGTRLNLPKEFFEFAKVGMNGGQTEYNMKDLGVYNNTYAEIALGHSRRITDRWTVGAKVKFLVGMYNGDFHVNNMRVVMGEDKWMVEGDGELTSAGMIDIPTKKKAADESTGKAETEELDFENIDFDSGNITSGGGMAFDLGATYKLRDDLELSASLLDLGFIRYKNVTKGTMLVEPWEFDGFKDIPYDSDNVKDGQTSIEDQIDNLGDDLEDCFRFNTQGKTSKAKALGATLNIGALYTLPYYDKLKFGFLSSTRIQGRYSWSEGRFSANIAPVKCFDASVSYAISSFGSSFGWILNVHTKGFNFFVGSNHQFFKVTPQFIPVHHATADINLGINFPFGSRKSL